MGFVEFVLLVLRGLGKTLAYKDKNMFFFFLFLGYSSNYSLVCFSPPLTVLILLLIILTLSLSVRILPWVSFVLCLHGLF